MVITKSALAFFSHFIGWENQSGDFKFDTCWLVPTQVVQASRQGKVESGLGIWGMSTDGDESYGAVKQAMAEFGLPDLPATWGKVVTRGDLKALLVILGEYGDFRIEEVGIEEIEIKRLSHD